MLQTISWKDYFITIGFGTVLYYGWWLFRYYRGWRWFKPDPPKGKTAEEVTATSAAVITLQQTVLPQQADSPQEQEPLKATLAEPEHSQPEPMQRESAKAELPQPENVHAQPAQPKDVHAQPAQPLSTAADPDYLPSIAADLKDDLIKYFWVAGMGNVKMEELLPFLRKVLADDPYPLLKGTPFQESVDKLIAGELERFGSIHPDPEVLRGLWELKG